MIRKLLLASVAAFPLTAHAHTWYRANMSKIACELSSFTPQELYDKMPVVEPWMRMAPLLPSDVIKNSKVGIMVRVHGVNEMDGGRPFEFDLFTSLSGCETFLKVLRANPQDIN